VPTGGGISYNDSTAKQQYYHGLFVQDDWRVTPKLTLNLGLRLDIDTGFTERFNRQGLFDPYAPNPLSAQTGLALNGAVAFSGVNGQPRNMWPTNAKLAPRVGFAYSISPKTVVRGAYGIFFLPISQRAYSTSSPGSSVSTSYVASIDGVTPVGSFPARR
jgi:outer membrane receptor protein involved in Fe transport